MALLGTIKKNLHWEALETALCSECGQPFSTRRQKLQAIPKVTRMVAGQILPEEITTYRHKVCP